MSRLLEEFNCREEVKTDTEIDRELLDKYRVLVLEKIADKGILANSVNESVIRELIDKVTLGYDMSNEMYNSLYNLIDGEVNGCGPIDSLLKNPSVNTIMINGPTSIYVEANGKLEKDESLFFTSNDHIIRCINKLLMKDVLNSDNPILDTVLKDGSRINAILPPISQDVTVTIRKVKKNVSSFESLIGNGTLTPYMARFLEASVLGRLNILVTGDVAGGKTTLLNILGNTIPDSERIVLLEDVRELDIDKKNLVSLEVSSLEDDDIDKLIRNAIRLRPDRIIIGEIYGRETLSILEAIFRGTDGVIASIYGNSVEDALKRLETNVMMSDKNLDSNTIREYIASSIDIVVHVSKLKDGRRKVTRISELKGVLNDKIVLKDIFLYRDNEFMLKKYRPKVLKKIYLNTSIKLDDMFKE